MTARLAGSARGARAPGVAWRWLGLAALLALVLAAPAGAGTPIPYAGVFREQLDATFFEPAPGVPPAGTRVSPAKVAAYREQLEKKLRFAIAHVSEFEQVEGGRGRKRARRVAEKSDLALALRVALQELDGIRPDADPVEAYDHAAKVITLDFATRSFTVMLSSIQIPIHLKNMVSDWSVADRTRADRVEAEAGNLVDPEDGSFYTREELAALVEAGSDLSELDPPSETFFWRAKPDISAVDIVSNYFEGGDPVHQGIVTEFPPFDGAVVELEGVHLTQSKPKLDVTYTYPDCLARPGARPSDCRRRIKLKFGMEIHADPPANALLAALGFNVDVSKHLRNVRVNLGDIPMQEVERDWASYFDRQRLHVYFPLDSVLAPGGAGRGRDEQGEYLIFPHAVAEVKDPGVERVGFFGFGHGIAANSREARALFMFNAWIANADMKDEENNKLSLRRDANGEWQIYLTQQDLGHSFGYVLPEKVSAYPWDLIETNPFSRWFGRLRGRIELTYINLQDNGLEETTTYADAKWMVRRIAQLTRDQIDTAVRLGHWPDSVARLYVEKLINRRNQMVEAFGLADEFAMLPVDRHLTTADGAVVGGELVQSRWEGTHMRFGEHWRDMVVPVGRKALETGIWALQAGAGSIDRIDPGRIRLSGPAVISPEILMELDREVLLNPQPTGRFDQYIVRDSVALGANVAAGFYGSVEGAWIKRYSLAYPVATSREGLLAGNRILSVLMPSDVLKGELPRQYVLLREDEFAAGVRVSSDDTGELFDVIGGTASVNRVVRRRSVLDRRGPVPLVWVDRPAYWRAQARAFLKAEFLEIPFAWGEVSRGELEGVAWQLDPDLLSAAGSDGTAVFERLLRFDDPGEIGRIQLQPPTRVRSRFDSRSLRWTVFFFSAAREASEDTITHETESGAPERIELQAARRRSEHWQLLDNGEEHGVAVTAYNAAADPGALDPGAATLVVNYRIDDLLAHNDEIDAYYDFLAGIGVLRPDVARDFDAQDWEVTGRPGGRWMRLLTWADVHYRAEALERLVALDPQAFWPRLAARLGVAPQRVQRLVQDVAGREPRLGMRGARLARGREREAIRHSLALFAALRRARGADHERARLRLLVKALDQAIFRSGQTFDPSVVAALHDCIDLPALVGEGAIFARGGIRRATDDENNLPERRAVVGQRGEPDGLRETNYRFFPANGIDLYQMLDWMRPESAGRAEGSSASR